MALRIVATIVSAVKCVCQKSSKAPACSSPTSRIASARNFCHVLRISAVATKPRIAGSSAGSVGSHRDRSKADSAARNPSQAWSTIFRNSASSFGILLKSDLASRPPAIERRSNITAASAAGVLASAETSMKASTSPVPMPPRWPEAASTAPTT
eukprot:CAMPEP_0115335192 /NCGR_PEP_ID=MMETSP0270-20121206/88315_1 /TAXON_ID=71861 /ORGANISM="Scrippsiella trochoidea, Strain CCMP3099" /LENGTH=153 /DNA_ID=CAMNT_0002756229 /DNA_START=51 /DNA_END=512 /DNA_ORIENTATION=-